MNIRNVLVIFPTLLAALVCSAGTAKAGFMVYGGATIGNDSSSTDGNGMANAVGGSRSVDLGCRQRQPGIQVCVRWQVWFQSNSSSCWCSAW